METSLVPSQAGKKVVGALQALLDGARDQVIAEHNNVHEGGPQLEAEMTMRMLELSESKRSVQQVAQGFIVAHVARQELWRYHPDGYSNLRHFLRAAGLGKSTVSDLTALGDILIPFCDRPDVNIPINESLTPENWPKLRDAIPVLRQAVNAEDKEKFTNILADVRQAIGRDAIRAKYRTPRAKYGQGTTMRLTGGRVLLVAVLDDDEAASLVIRRLGGALDWTLVADPRMVGSTLKVVVDNVSDSLEGPGLRDNPTSLRCISETE